MACRFRRREPSAEAGPTSPPLPRAVAGTASPTTLRTSAAEVSAPSRAAPAAPAARRWLVLAVLGVPVFVAGALAVYLIGDRPPVDESARRPVARPIAAEDDERAALSADDPARKARPRLAASACHADSSALGFPSCGLCGRPRRNVRHRAPHRRPARGVGAEPRRRDRPAQRQTPWRDHLRVGGGPRPPRPRIRLSLKGYAEAEATLATDRSDTTFVKLRPLKASRPAPGLPKPKPID
jgi:hypothetical protein